VLGFNALRLLVRVLLANKNVHSDIELEAKMQSMAQAHSSCFLFFSNLMDIASSAAIDCNMMRRLSKCVATSCFILLFNFLFRSVFFMYVTSAFASSILSKTNSDSS